MHPSRAKAAVAVLAILFGLRTMQAQAQEEASTESVCLSSLIASVPSRPSFSNGAATTQCGVLETEYGWNRQWPGGGIRQDSLGGGLRLGLTRRLDFHWSSDSLVNVLEGNQTQRGFGDTWLGFKYRFHEQSKRIPALGLLYLAKMPSASESKGLGTGQADHALSFLVSKDVRKLHFDFNAIEFLGGRPSGPAFDHCTQYALSASAPLKGRWGAIVEGYGANELNPDTPAFASTMAGLTYQLSPRLVFDGGLDIGVTHGAPGKRVYAGITYAIANAYSWIRPNRY